MLEEFERCLADGGCLESVRDQLRRQTEAERQAKLRKIDQDYRAAVLLRFGLTQAKDDPGYAIAVGHIRWLRKKYPSTEHDYVRDIRKMLWLEEHPAGRRKGNDSKKGNADGSARDESGNDGGGDSGEAILSTPVPEIEP